MDCPSKLDFTEALKDSPRFRKQLHEHEVYFGKFEGRLNEILRLVTAMVEYGQNYVATFYNLSECMRETSEQAFGHDPMTVDAFKSVSNAFVEIVGIHRILIEQAHWSIHKKISEFLKREIASVHNFRKHFEQLSVSLDEALARKAALPKQKTAEINDATNALTAVGTCFSHIALDYVAQISVVHSTKAHETLEAFTSFLQACGTFFERGHSYVEEWNAKEENGLVQKAIESLKAQSKNVERKVQDRHLLVPKELYQYQPGMSPEDDVVMEGYLFKRSSNAFKLWHRRWFQIKDSRLLYCHKVSGSDSDGDFSDGNRMTVIQGDLKLCLVRPAPANVERACCFELVTPSKCHLLQADSESLCTAWMRALQRTIHDLHESDHQMSGGNASPKVTTFRKQHELGQHQQGAAADGSAKMRLSAGNGSTTSGLSGSTDSVSKSPEDSVISFLNEVRAIKGNEVCADCGHSDPRWASINLGIVLCIECSGAHRSLGVQLSKVRSLTLDTFDSDHRRIMLALGNSAVNGAYLKFLPNKLNDIVPPPAKPDSSRAAKEVWIKAKYVEKRFSRPSLERAEDQSQLRNEHLFTTSRNRHKSPTPLNLNNGVIPGRRRSNSVEQISSAPDLSPTLEEEPVGRPDGDGGCNNDAVVTMNNNSTTDDDAQSPLSPDSRAAWRSSPALYRRNRSPALSGMHRRLSAVGSDPSIPNSLLDESLEDHQRLLDPAQLFEVVKGGDLVKVIIILSSGVDVNGRHENTTALHTAIQHSADSSLSEFLMLNGAKINALDGQLNSPLHLAAKNGRTLQVCQLLKRGAEKDLMNQNGQTPLDLAVDGEHADIVTLLRLQRMREEFSEEFNNPMDDTMTGIMDDITRQQQKHQLQQQKPSQQGDSKVIY